MDNSIDDGFPPVEWQFLTWKHGKRGPNRGYDGRGSGLGVRCGLGPVTKVA